MGWCQCWVSAERARGSCLWGGCGEGRTPRTPSPVRAGPLLPLGPGGLSSGGRPSRFVLGWEGRGPASEIALSRFTCQDWGARAPGAAWLGAKGLLVWGVGGCVRFRGRRAPPGRAPGPRRLAAAVTASPHSEWREGRRRSWAPLAEETPCPKFIRRQLRGCFIVSTHACLLWLCDGVSFLRWWWRVGTCVACNSLIK